MHEGCARLKAAGYVLVVATNQPDVGRGTQTRAMVEAMQLKGHPVTDDNEADALALLHWALAQGADPALGKEARHG